MKMPSTWPVRWNSWFWPVASLSLAALVLRHHSGKFHRKPTQDTQNLSADYHQCPNADLYSVIASVDLKFIDIQI